MSTLLKRINGGWIGQVPDRMTIGYSPEYVQPYWVEPQLGTMHGDTRERYDKIHEWVEQTFGAKTEGWNNPRWSASNRKYWFKNEKDRTLFVFRWS